MDDRQAQLLTLVIDAYIETAEPVGSRFLVEEGNLDWSEATVRNELRALEEAGYLTHPHTSAGRIPTVSGYELYLSKIDPAGLRVKASETEKLAAAKKVFPDYEASCKNIAKTLVDISKESVIVAFSSEKMYYTGLSNLFSKPDFAEMKLVASVSRVFDRCEEYLPRFYDRVGSAPRPYLGREHPFGEMLSVVASRFGENSASLIVLLGPQRMNYKHNWSLLKQVRELI
ncbi:MAG: Transcriptional regulator of heat shock protein [Parcubacteria group bacterium GW2011_GWC2_45_7]|nr:MAG: Transcriptional regulator of heat shock protein [Parcubacteria group bacterium GW2011_GWC2_45_7]